MGAIEKFRVSLLVKVLKALRAVAMGVSRAFCGALSLKLAMTFMI